MGKQAVFKLESPKYYLHDLLFTELNHMLLVYQRNMQHVFILLHNNLYVTLPVKTQLQSFTVLHKSIQNKEHFVKT